jgi:signal transduction histidine kinase
MLTRARNAREPELTGATSPPSGQPGRAETAVVHSFAEEQAALRRVAAIAAAGKAPQAVFDAVTAEAFALLGAMPTALTRFEAGGAESVVVAQTGDHVEAGLRMLVTGDGVAARMWRSGDAQRVDDYAGVAGTTIVEELGVRAAVAVPVTVDGNLWGALATSSKSGPLPVSTEDRLTMFAEVVAAAVVSAQARTSVGVLADEQAALLRVAALVARGAAETAIFDAVAVEAAALIDDEPTTLVRYEGRRTFTVLATRKGPAPVGVRFTVPEDDVGTLDAMLRTLKPARLDRYADVADQSFSRREFGVGSSVSVPVVVHGRLWGSLGTLNEGRRLPAETEGRLAKFAELVASALANVEARAELARFGAEQAALRRVAELAASGASSPHVLQAIVTEASGLFDGAVVSLVREGTSGTWRRIEVDGGPGGGSTPSAASVDEDTLARSVLTTGRPARVQDDGDLPSAARPEDEGFLWASGVPVRVEGETWGALLATRGQRPLPSGTEDRLTQFAQIAATAVTGARSRDALSRLAGEQAALRRVAELVARGAALDEVFDAVATEASNILGESAANLFRYDDGLATVVAACRSPVPVGLQTPTDGDSAGARLLRARRPLRFATLAGTASAELARELHVGALVVVPITVEGRIWGGLSTTTSGDPPPADAEDRLAEFAELAAAAIASAENKAKLRASRARVVTTADETRQRLQRDVHDGAQQRLVQTVLTLRLGLDAAGRGEDTIGLMREALVHAERATVELRELVHGILPASLSRGGLRAGLESLITGLTVPVDLDVSALPEERLPAELEVTAYFVVAEALTNVVKHAKATLARVGVAREAELLTIEVTDDGIGGADPHGGTGLTGLSDRVDAMDGTLFLASPGGTGTIVRVTLPVG